MASEPAMPAILAEGIRKRFGSVQALDGVDLAAGPGTVLGLLGPNGAGKTTMVRVLTTLIRPDAGRARVAGFDVSSQGAAVRAVIGLAGQQTAIDPLLTGRENLELIASLHHLRRGDVRARAGELLERFDLAGAAGRRAGGYSGGMRRRLDLAAALVAEPRVLVLDEPTAGLDPRSRLGLWETLRGLVDGGTTALLTTQYLDEADQLADRIAVLDAGRVVAEGTPDQLKAKIGGHRVEIRFASPADAGHAARTIADLADRRPAIDELSATLVVPVAGGPAPLADIVRRLDTAEIEIVDLVVRHPTLDDVFLTLTGRAAQPMLEPAGGAAP
jgi:ABC-2 type transport system ATP-binding protein